MESNSGGIDYQKTKYKDVPEGTITTQPYYSGLLFVLPTGAQIIMACRIILSTGQKLLIITPFIPMAEENKQASGYQICYSTRRDFKKAGKNVTVNKASVRTLWLKKLHAGRTCYVRVRTVKKFTSAVTGKMITVYGRWSATRRFKVKR